MAMTAEPGAWLDRVNFEASNHASVQLDDNAASPPPFAHDEVAAFLAALFALRIRSGYPALRLDSDAIALLVRRSGGTRYALRALAELSMFVARLENASCITAGHVEAAWLINQETSDLDDEPRGEALRDDLRCHATAPIQPISACASQRLPSPSVFTLATREWPARHMAFAGTACVVIALGLGLGFVFKPAARQSSEQLAALRLPRAPEIALAARAPALPPTTAADLAAAWPSPILRSQSPGLVLTALAAAAPAPAPATPVLAVPGLSTPAPTVPASSTPVLPPPVPAIPAPAIPAPAIPAPAIPVSAIPLQVIYALALPTLPLPAPEPTSGLGFAALPHGAVLHVTVTYPRGNIDDERSAAEAIRSLRAAGYDVADPEQVVGSHFRQIGVGYFFVEDATAAVAIAQRLGGRAQLLSIASGVLPRPGTIRISLSSRPPATPPGHRDERGSAS